MSVCQILQKVFEDNGSMRKKLEHMSMNKKNRISAAKRVEEYNQENLEIAKISINISKNSIFANRVIGFSVLLFLF